MMEGLQSEALEGYLELKSSDLVATSCQARALLLLARNPVLSASLAGLRET